MCPTRSSDWSKLTNFSWNLLHPMKFNIEPWHHEHDFLMEGLPWIHGSSFHVCISMFFSRVYLLFVVSTPKKNRSENTTPHPFKGPTPLVATISSPSRSQKLGRYQGASKDTKPSWLESKIACKPRFWLSLNDNSNACSKLVTWNHTKTTVSQRRVTVPLLVFLVCRAKEFYPKVCISCVFCFQDTSD